MPIKKRALRTLKGGKIPIIVEKKEKVRINRPLLLANSLANEVKKKIEKKLGVSLRSKAFCLEHKDMALILPLYFRKKYSPRNYISQTLRMVTNLPANGYYNSNFDSSFFKKVSKEAKKDEQWEQERRRGGRGRFAEPEKPLLSERFDRIARRTEGHKDIVFLHNPFTRMTASKKLFEKEKRVFKKVAFHEHIHEILSRKIKRKLDEKTIEGLTDYFTSRFFEKEFPNMSTKKRMSKLGYPTRFSLSYKRKLAKSALKWDKILGKKSLQEAMNLAVDLIRHTSVKVHNRKHKKKYKSLVDLLYDAQVKKKSFT